MQSLLVMIKVISYLRKIEDIQRNRPPAAIESFISFLLFHVREQQYFSLNIISSCYSVSSCIKYIKYHKHCLQYYFC